MVDLTGGAEGVVVVAVVIGWSLRKVLIFLSRVDMVVPT